MNSFLLEYVWIGGNNELRSKIKVINSNKSLDELNFNEIKEWDFDGSSTNQANGNDSEIIIKPVKLYNNPFYKERSLLVLCDTWYPDGSPHETNNRYKADLIFKKALDKKPMFGMEQEFFLIDPATNLPLGFPQNGFPEPQGKYYCSVGTSNSYLRQFLDEAMYTLFCANIPVTGCNYEVCPGQMEIQVCSIGIEQADNLIITRYILHRLSERYNVRVDFNAKPVKGDWNGSGCHTNFSTIDMRENENGYELILEAIKKLENKHIEHIRCYGNDNYQRLTGLHETAHISEFSYGVANRGASIRIPRTTEKNKKGYFEDRRPSSSCDPYLVTSKIFETCCL